MVPTFGRAVDWEAIVRDGCCGRMLALLGRPMSSSSAGGEFQAGRYIFFKFEHLVGYRPALA